MASVKLTANSLIETVVAMTIASMVFSVGLIIYINVVRSMDQEYPLYLEAKAHYLLDSLTSLTEIPVERTFLATPSLEATFNLSPFQQFDRAFLATCTVSDSLFVTASAQKIIYHEPAE